MEIFFNSNVRTRNNMDFRFVLFILNNFSACLSSWSSSMPKTEIYHGISPVTEKILECFGRTDCVTDLSQPGDPSQHRSVCSVQGVAKSGTTERSSLKLYWTKSCRNPWLGEMPSNVIQNFFVTRRWGQTIGELCFMYVGVAICLQVTVSEVLPMESKLQSLEIAHSVSFLFLITSCWLRCQLPCSWVSVLLSFCGMGGEEGEPELGIAECGVMQAQIAPLFPCWITGCWQGLWQVTVLGTQGQPTFVFRVLLPHQRHLLIPRCMEQQGWTRAWPRSCPGLLSLWDTGSAAGQREHRCVCAKDR